MDNMRRKSSKRYKKRKGNQYTTGKVVESVIKQILDEIEAAEGNKVVPKNLVDNPAKEAEYDIDMTLNSTTLSVQSNASFSKLKDFPVLSEELKFVSTPSPCDKKQIDGATPTPSSTSSNRPKSELEHFHVKSIASTYQIIDLDILAETYSAMACPECLNTSCLKLERINKQGLSLQLRLSCTVCEFCYSFWTSKQIDKKRSYDINKRSVYAFRRLGKGYAGMKKFLVLMNLPPPMTKKNYSKIARLILKAVKSVAQSTMNEPAKEIKTMVLMTLLFSIPQYLMMVPGRGVVFLP